MLFFKRVYLGLREATDYELSILLTSPHEPDELIYIYIYIYESIALLLQITCFAFYTCTARVAEKVLTWTLTRLQVQRPCCVSLSTTEKLQSCFST